MSAWIKVIFFSLLVVLSTYFFALNLRDLLLNPSFMVSLNMDAYYPLIKVTLSFYLLSCAFALLVTLSPAVYSKLVTFLIASSSFYLVFDRFNASIYALALFVIFLVVTWEIRNQLKSYFNFNPRIIFSSSLHLQSTLLVVFVSVAFFFRFSFFIDKNGFHIPPQLIDQVTNSTVGNLLSQFNITDMQEASKKSDLAKIGLNNNDLKNLQKQVENEDLKKQVAQNLNQQLTKNINDALEPYIKYIPLATSVILFISFQTIIGLSFFLVPLILSFLFFGLEKTKIIHFQTQTQEVKRLVLRAEDQIKKHPVNITDKELKDWVN